MPGSAACGSASFSETSGMVRLRHYWGLLLLSGIAFPAFSPALAEQSGTAPELSGTVWQWQQTLINDDDKFVPDSPVDYTVQFMADGTVAVQSDCNHLRGTYTVEGNAITIALGPSTMAACPEDSLGERFAGQLVGAAVYFFRSGDLYVDLKYDSGTMRFEPQSSELAGTRWVVIGRNNGRGGSSARSSTPR